MKITIEILDERIADYVGRAYIGYWCDDSAWSRKTLSLAVHESDPDAGSDGWCRVGPAQFATALGIMATQFPARFAELVSDSGDMYTGDLLVQLACFGEEKYS
jgi:hypothetical protein